MKGFLIRVWDLILPGWRWLYEPQVGVSTPRGTVSTRGTTMSSPSLLRFVDVWKDYDPGIGPYPARRWLQETWVGVSTPCGAITNLGTTVFVPGLLKSYMC